MGTTQTKPHHAHVFSIDDWQKIQWQPYTNIKDPTFSSNFTVYAHKNNPNLQIQKYQVFFNSQAEYISYLETYYDRKRFPTLVNSLHIEPTTKKNMCSTFYYAYVYTERINFRLFELIDIPVQEGLYIIDSTLEGYEKMFEKTGYFQVSSDMIGINKHGKVKAWVNKNFSKNFPQFNKIDHNKNQNDFIRLLIKIIQDSIDYPNCKQKFSEFLIKKKLKPTFQLTRIALKQYQKIYGYNVQKSMKSIVSWIKKQNNKSSHSNTQILQQLKTSTYSTASQKIPSSSNKTPQINKSSKKIQFDKIKTRRMNHSNDKTMYVNKVDDSPFQQHLDLNLNFNQNIIPQNNNHQFLCKQRQSVPERLIANQTNNNPVANINRNEKKPPQNIMKNSNKTMKKLPPSVSFSYKSSGLYSPQSLQSQHNEWFSHKKVSKTTLQTQKSKVIQHKKSLGFDIVEDLEQKIKFYYNNNNVYQIDPDIAKDLQSMTTSLNK